MANAFPHVYGAIPGAIGSTMPDTENESPVREDWRDWWPDEPTDPERLLTRQELAEHAQAHGISITEQDIANWQSTGILPRGIGQRTGRTLRMLYPPRYLDLLRGVRELQHQGARLAVIGPLLRVRHTSRNRTRTAPQTAAISVPDATDQPRGAPVVFRPPAAAVAASAGTPTIHYGTGSASSKSFASGRAHVRRGDPVLTANDELTRTLRDIARAHEQAYGGRIVKTRLTLIDSFGNPVTLSVDTD